MEEIAGQALLTEEWSEAVTATGETKKEPNELEDGFRDSSQDKEAEDMPTTMVDSVSLSNLENSFERLLQRQRSEIMFELRRLQYGERPVTGQEHRRRTVENLVLRAVGPPMTTTTAPEPRSAAAGPGGAVESVPGHLSRQAVAAAADVTRPEHIIVEVNALVERRPVSSLLSSLQFRRSLENSVRGALRAMTGGSTQGGSVIRTTPPPVARATNSPNARAAAADTEAEVQPHSSEATRSSTDLSVRSESPQSSAVAMETRPDVIVQPPVPGVVDAPGTSAGTTRAEEWIQRHVPLPADPVVGRQRSSVDVLNQMHHEEFVVEISDLIHRQLVTSALNGGFRDVLERRMRRHMEASGIDGSRVQEQLRQLPRSNVHLRNDFIDLGIIPGAVGTAAGDVGDAMDDVSVISATAAVALPQAYAQNNVAIGREIHSLRTELQELKNMMRLSFDLQLDIQRSIRQEVAAALAQTLGGSSGPLPSASTTSGRSAATSGASVERCLICDDHQVDTVLYQCGHLCLCHACALQLRQNGSNCPVCRAPIRDIMRTYRP